jgi:DNA-directed RNA polymerase subunit RPC12/RpoP
MECSNCGKKLDNDSEFCYFCGNKMEKDKKPKNLEESEKIKCPKCGENMNKDWGYCYHCGYENKTKPENDNNIKDEGDNTDSVEDTKIEEPNLKLFTEDTSKIQTKNYKLKTLVTLFSVLFSIFFIVSIVLSIFLFNNIYNNNVLKDDLESLQGDYGKVTEDYYKLQQDSKTLNLEYEEILKKSQYIPVDSEDSAKITGKIEEVFELLSQKILYIHFLKCIKSYDEYIAKLDEYHVGIYDDVLENGDNYWREIVDTEIEIRNTCINLERQYANNQISYNTYTTRWDNAFNNYNNEYKRLDSQLTSNYDQIVTQYDKQFSDAYDNHISQLNEADKERDQRLDELMDDMDILYEFYNVGYPSSGWFENADLEIFGLKELTEKYDLEIDDLYYE